MTNVDIGDLVVNLRWPHYGTCLVIGLENGKVVVLNQEGEFAQKPGYSWDYARNWIKIDQKNKKNV